MRSSFEDFINVLNFQVSWSEANILFVLLSSLIYLSLILLMLNAIWTAVVLEEKNSENRKKLANMTLTKKPIHGFCSFVYSNSVKHRNDFCKQLSSYKKVDAGGNCLNNVGKKVKDKWRNCCRFLS